jgi:hypothetical protein
MMHAPSVAPSGNPVKMGNVASLEDKTPSAMTDGAIRHDSNGVIQNLNRSQ